MGKFLLVCLGGAAGSGARYLVSLWLAPAPGASSVLPFSGQWSTSGFTVEGYQPPRNVQIQVRFSF